MMKKNKITHMLVGSVIFFYSGIVLADLSAGSVANLSGSNNISNTNSSTITLRWAMQVSGNATSGALSGSVITSPTGIFTIPGGRVLGTNSKIISQTVTPTVLATTVRITETVRIPKSILFAASEQGLTQIAYTRSFTDCPGPSCSSLLPSPSITLNLTGGTGGSFGVSSYKLRFDSDQIASIVSRGDELKAVAFINVTRTGTIRGVWEVATPASTAGNPVYKVIQTVQRQLTNFATNELSSPSLPTDSTGIYLVRFRFQDPLLEGEVPTLRYNVTIESSESGKTVRSIKPGAGEKLAPNTEFEWDPMPGASAYKLEFIIPPSNMNPDNKIEDYTPVAGVLIKSDDAKTLINKAVAEKLKSGETYWWHVIGLNKAGKPIGMSGWTPINVE